MTVQRVQQAYAGGVVDIAVDDDPGGGQRPDLWPSVGEYPFYDPYLYYLMSTDVARNDAFRTALLPHVAGRTVLDIGTGQDMNWALEAAAAGAGRVVAVEAIEDTYRTASQRLATRPESATVDLFHGRSFDLMLPSRADVCVAELIGTIASSEGMLAVMADAHRRLLIPDAVVVPAACDTMVGAVSVRSMFPTGLAFSYDGLPYLEQVFHQYGRPFDIRLTVANPGPGSVLSTAEAVETLRFDTVQRCDATTAATLTVTRAGEIDGFLLWIRLAAGGDAPVVDSLTDKSSWTPAYVPVFDTPVAVRGGETVHVEFERRTSDDGVHPDYALNATVLAANGPVTGRGLSTHHGSGLGTNAVHRELWGLR